MHAQTRRQREVLDFIGRYIDLHGYRPSYQTIARHLGLNSRAGIVRIVHGLETQGLLTRRREDGHFFIDMGGGDAANIGVLIEWLDVPNDAETREGWQNRPFSLPEFMLGGNDPAAMRAFRVTDNAMAAENICENDIALIELREFARDGQRVVAILDQKRTVLRKYYRTGSNIELRPADDDETELISLSADLVRVAGIYRGLVRPAI